MRKDIKHLVAYYVKKYRTRDPFELANKLNIELQIGDLGSRCGCYMYLKKHRCIFLNENLDRNEQLIVMSHELGHAIMHQKENCYFIRNKTLLLTSKLELEANTFAMELLLPDETLIEYSDYTISQFSNMTGYPKELIELRLKQL